MTAERYILFLLTLCVYGLRADDEIDHLVDQLNKILAFPGWAQLSGIEIVLNDGSEIDEYIAIDDVLATGPNEKIVNSENVKTKLKHVHHFLTCKYSTMLNDCCDYIKLAVEQCEQMAAFECLAQLVKLYEATDPLVLLIQGTLSYFHQTSLDIKYNESYSKILKGFKHFYGLLKISFDRKVTANPYAEILIIENKLWTVKRQLRQFFDLSCYPLKIIEDELKEHDQTYNSLLSNASATVSSPKDHINAITDRFQNKLNEFIQSNEAFGFMNDTVSNTVRPMLDNQALGNPTDAELDNSLQ